MISLSISSTATAQVNKDSTVTLPVPILRKAIIDLETGDAAKKENVILYNTIKLLNQKSSQQDSIINAYKAKEKYYQNIVLFNEGISKEYKIYITQLESDNRKLKRKNLFNKIIYGGIITGLGYIAITK